MRRYAFPHQKFILCRYAHFRERPDHHSQDAEGSVRPTPQCRSSSRACPGGHLDSQAICSSASRRPSLRHSGRWRQHRRLFGAAARQVITAVDTSVLLDVFLPDDEFGEQSRSWLRAAYDAGAVLVSDIVYAELVPAFRERSALDRALGEINAKVSHLNTAMAYEAGLRWQRYRQAGGPRERIITDFLIGAHAASVAESFLTRDRGFYETYFPELKRN